MAALHLIFATGQRYHEAQEAVRLLLPGKSAVGCSLTGCPSLPRHILISGARVDLILPWGLGRRLGCDDAARRFVLPEDITTVFNILSPRFPHGENKVQSSLISMGLDSHHKAQIEF